MKKLKVISVLFLTIFVGNITAQNATDIANQVYNRSTPKNGESDMTMTLINKKGSERTRVLHQFFIDLGSTEKQIMFFTSPADVKNTSFMNWSYSEEGKSDDQWLYLPALKKVKRISSSSKDNEFMGSDFTYEDMEKRNPNRDVQSFLRTETFNGEEVWVIQSIPKLEEQYSKRIIWISKEKLIPLKVEFYDEDEELLKTLTITKSLNIKKYWVIKEQEMYNIQDNHKTIISFKNIVVEEGISESKFNQRTMTKGL
ncbi:MAG: outer membrane lipoprotein-sorting protein [Flavobacteriales bacterium]|jgi:outer membrane lipoprotein-sorting protein|nr:outer membrane lipoprotein-sorting protein [Flavobacteriales bacterium]